MATFHDYSLFGLKVQSSLHLPELSAAGGAGSSDISITTGSVEDVGGEDFVVKAVGGDLYLNVPEVARFRVSNGRDIVVDAVPDVPARNVRIYLLGSAFGALLHQRGLLPLHANAVEINGYAVAFMGASGAGKSTLAAWFHDQGDEVIADDVCVVGFDGDGSPYAATGVPRLRLWAEALKAMDQDPADFERSFVGANSSLDKFDVPIRQSDRHPGNTPLAALYVLEQGDDFAITRIEGMEAVAAASANTYRGSYLAAVNGQQEHWRASIQLVRQVPVFRAVRRWDLAKLDDQCRRLRSHALKTVGNRQEEEK